MPRVLPPAAVEFRSLTREGTQPKKMKGVLIAYKVSFGGSRFQPVEKQCCSSVTRKRVLGNAGREHPWEDPVGFRILAVAVEDRQTAIYILLIWRSPKQARCGEDLVECDIVVFFGTCRPLQH